MNLRLERKIYFFVVTINHNRAFVDSCGPPLISTLDPALAGTHHSVLLCSPSAHRNRLSK